MHFSFIDRHMASPEKTYCVTSNYAQSIQFYLSLHCCFLYTQVVVMLRWHFWRSKGHRIFAVQCKTCHCACIYEWDKHEPRENKRASVCWFLSFMMTNPEGCMDIEPEPMPACARWGGHRLGESGIMMTESKTDNVDVELC